MRHWIKKEQNGIGVHWGEWYEMVLWGRTWRSYCQSQISLFLPQALLLLQLLLTLMVTTTSIISLLVITILSLSLWKATRSLPKMQGNQMTTPVIATLILHPTSCKLRVTITIPSRGVDPQVIDSGMYNPAGYENFPTRSPSHTYNSGDGGQPCQCTLWASKRCVLEDVCFHSEVNSSGADTVILISIQLSVLFFVVAIDGSGSNTISN